MKGCELCDRAARMYCESDQASLCWECDAKVHGANFLVARHPRVLLCKSCQAPTPWRAAGARLSPTFSACESCALHRGKISSSAQDEEWGGEAEAEEEMMEEDDFASDSDEEEDDEEEEEEEEGENQVVPWSQTPPPPASSSSGEESSWNGTSGTDLLNQMRDNVDLASQHNHACSPSHRIYIAASPPPPARSVPKDSRKTLLLRSNPPSVTAAGAENYFSARGDCSNFDLSSSTSLSHPPI